MRFSSFGTLSALCLEFLILMLIVFVLLTTPPLQSQVSHGVLREDHVWVCS